jgi:hypothetical protein
MLVALVRNASPFGPPDRQSGEPGTVDRMWPNPNRIPAAQGLS